MFERVGFGRVGMGIGTGALALVLLGARPASAGDEFEDGFKDELGRIAAHEAVRSGRQILAGILLGGPRPAPHYGAAPYYEPGPYAAAPYGRAVYHEHRHDHYHHYPVSHGYREHSRWGHWGQGHRHGHKHHRHCDD